MSLRYLFILALSSSLLLACKQQETQNPTQLKIEGETEARAGFWERAHVDVGQGDCKAAPMLLPITLSIEGDSAACLNCERDYQIVIEYRDKVPEALLELELQAGTRLLSGQLRYDLKAVEGPKRLTFPLRLQGSPPSLRVLWMADDEGFAMRVEERLPRQPEMDLRQEGVAPTALPQPIEIEGVRIERAIPVRP